jgi:hypothetical protein
VKAIVCPSADQTMLSAPPERFVMRLGSPLPSALTT